MEEEVRLLGQAMRLIGRLREFTIPGKCHAAQSERAGLENSPISRGPGQACHAADVIGA